MGWWSDMFKLNWTDEDFERIEPDVVIGAADLERWPGIEPDPEAEARIARDCHAGLIAALARERARDSAGGPATARRHDLAELFPPSPGAR